ncbi:MAG: Teichoic acid translocation permease protein TagG [Verrucomicrobiota bacterium]|jgi:lipopolysaccharide transport system permease protein
MASAIIKRLIEHRELLLRFTSRQIQRQTKGSWLGLLWVLVNPLLLLALYTFVFGLIMGGDFKVMADPGPFDYPLGIFIGLTVMGLVTETMGQAPHIILAHQNLVKKVVFPLYLLPLATVGSIFFKALISCLLAVLFILLAGTQLSWAMLWFPLILLPVLLCAIGLAWLISALGVYFRDSQQLMAFLGTALFYGSAVFYPSNSIPAPVYDWLRYNPVLHAIELSRDVLLWNIPLDPLKLAYLYGCGVVLFLLGLLTFQGLRHGFADVL